MNATRWQQLKSLYDSAMDFTVRKRRAYLDALSRKSVAEDLERLLQGESAIDGFLEKPAVEALPPETFRRERAFASGDVLADRWEIKDFIGAGGMGEVYRAWDRELRQPVALKTLPADLSGDAALLARLRQEVRLARRVTHPNVCRLYEISSTLDAKGRQAVFFTMELLEGSTLREMLAGGPLAPELRDLITPQIVAGLTAAHEQGIIHRDLKPGNIIVTKAGDSGLRAVITDFGLAREVVGGVGESLTAVGAGSILGTPAYMAPEQLQGERVSAATDVYAFGVLLFEMVTGRNPHEGTSPLTLAMARLNEPAPDVRRFAPEVSEAWAGTIAACLERDAANRPQSVSEVGRMAAGEIAPPRSFSRRAVVAASAAGVAVVAGAVVSLRPLWKGKPWNPEAIRHVEVGQEFAKRRTSDSLTNAIAEFEKAIALERGYAPAWAGLADAYSAQANYNFAPPRPAMDKARQAALEAVRLDPNSGRANGVLGYVTSIDLRKWTEAGPSFVRAEQMAPQDPLIRLWYGAWLGKSGESQKALDQLNRGLASEPASFVLHHQCAVEYLRAGRIAEMTTEAHELVRLQPYEASSHLILARALEWSGQYEQALASCAQAEKYGNAITAKCHRACILAAAGKGPAAAPLADEVTNYWRENPFETLQLAQLLARMKGLTEVLAVLEAGYDRDDSTILGAPTSPYFAQWRQQRAWTNFNSKLGYLRL